MASSAVTPTPATPSTPPNFYAQAAMGQQSAPSTPDYSQQNSQFRNAVTKLLTIFDKLEKLTPNGEKIEKDVKAMADTLKACRDRVLQGDEGEDEDEEKKSTAATPSQATGTASGGATSPAGAGSSASAPGTGAA